MKEALAEELRNRVAEAIEAKMNESVIEDLEEGISPEDYSTHGVKSQFGGYRAHIKHKTRGHTMYTGSHVYDTSSKAKGEAAAYLKGYAEGGDNFASKNARVYAKQHAASGPYANKNEEAEQIDELSKKTLGSYIKKASDNAAIHGMKYGEKKAQSDEMDRLMNRHMSYSDKDKVRSIMKTTSDEVDAPRQKAAKRLRGIDQAVNRLTRD